MKDGTLDNTFVIGNGANNYVYSSALQANDKVLIGGDFTQYNGVSVNRIARLNSDGSLDTTFNSGSGVNNRVTSITIQTDGKIILSGSFTSYNGISKNRLVRLNLDGTLDSTFNIGSGANGTISSIALQADGKIIIGGDFTQYNGISVNRIARLNSDGGLDISFNSGLGFNDVVKSIIIQADGNFVVGGDFTQFNGTDINRIVRLNTNGILDRSFNQGIGFNGIVMSLKLQTDGKILAVGDFTSYNSTIVNRIIRLNQNGSIDANFNSGNGANAYIETISIDLDGNVLIGGGFSQYNGIETGYVTRIRVDGYIDSTFLNKNDNGANDLIEETAVQTDNKILIVGNFTEYNSITRNRIARLNSDGSLDTTFNPGTGANFVTPINESIINSLAVQTDGKILIGGSFTTFNGVSRNRIARLNSDGSLDTTFNPGAGANLDVNSLAVQTDGKILIGGSFTTFNGVSRNRIARLNSEGSLDTTFNPGTGANSNVNSLVIQADSKILVGGEFTTYNGITRNGIARLNSDGSLDTTFNPGTGVDFLIWKISLQLDNKVLIGGSFSSYNGVSRKNIARLNSDGSLDLTFNPGIGANNIVQTILCQSDNKILIGGAFSKFNGVESGKLARLNSDGSLDNTFDSSSGADRIITSINSYSNGKVIISGYFYRYKESPIINIARINGDCINPSTPNGSSVQTLLPGSLINELNASGTNIKWYENSSGGTVLPSTTLLENGKTYYASQTVNGCESTERLAVKVTLDYNNFSIESKSETCSGKNNGEINITANLSYSYVARINGNSYNFTNNKLSVTGLAPGTYSVCITIPGKIFEQCYTIVLKQGGSLTGKIATLNNSVMVSINEGTAPYKVYVNGKESLSTNTKDFILNVDQGGLIEVKTAVACEGILSKTIDFVSFGSASAYPNPTSGEVYLKVPSVYKELEIELYSADSKLILKHTFPVINGQVKLDISKAKDGVYLVRILTKEPMNIKIIKRQ